MSALPSISVLMPVYNTARYIEDAIASILAQTLPATEIVVIDDGSSDGSAEKAEAFSGVVVLRKEHSGIAETLNHGLARVKADYLSFLDADDLWVPTKLERQLSAMKGAEGPDLVFGNVEQFHSEDVGPDVRARIHCQAGSQPGYSCGTMLARWSSFKRVGEFNPRWRVGCFIDWYARAREAGLTSVMLPDLFLRRRLHGGNTGLLLKEARPDFASIMKASLDRRRAADAH
jgi:glycosyltransferase involved in cell wall biosynthesis